MNLFLVTYRPDNESIILRKLEPDVSKEIVARRGIDKPRKEDKCWIVVIQARGLRGALELGLTAIEQEMEDAGERR